MRDEPWGNVVWAALTGPQRQLAQVVGRAHRYHPAVAPFAALPAEPTERDWDDLETLSGGSEVVIFRVEPMVPVSWTVHRTFATFQMIATDPPVAPDADVEVLTKADVPEMVALARLTNPGPFFERTIELGTYLGIRQEGRIVAMAGERFQPDGASEISAVCTHPDHRGRGHARTLVAALAHRIRAHGRTPFLHVIQTNPAKRIYDELGFRVQATPVALDLMPPGNG